MAGRQILHFLHKGVRSASSSQVAVRNAKGIRAVTTLAVEDAMAVPVGQSLQPAAAAHDGGGQGSTFWWGATWTLTAGVTTAAFGTQLVHAESSASAETTSLRPRSKPTVIFVLGGPGSGKGTQCANIVKEFGFVHLSAGDLLREEIKSGSEHGNMISNMIKEGKIVPSSVTVGLLEKAMEASGNDKFLIDGFPRNDENRGAFERDTGIEPDFILFFDCPEEVMEQRLLKRSQSSGRTDDNIETIKKRFRVFVEQSLPVVEHYELQGKVRKVTATKPPQEVFAALKPYFRTYLEADVLAANQALLDSIEASDYATYAQLCDAKLTSFEPETQGHLVEGLPFHKFYFDAQASSREGEAPRSSASLSSIASPKVKLVGDNSAVVTYVRLRQSLASPKVGMTDAYQETRVWERRRAPNGEWQWKNVHFHRSPAPSV